MPPDAVSQAQERVQAESGKLTQLASDAHLVSQRRATALLPVMNLSGLMQARRGGIEDVIDRATNAFQSMINAQTGRVGAAEQGLEFAIDREELAQKQEEERFATEFALRQLTGGQIEFGGETFKIPAPKQTGGTGDPSTYYDDSPTSFAQPEQQPARPLPRFKSQMEGQTSKGGQWMFSGGQWLPIVD
jgi:hypothetical protein